MINSNNRIESRNIKKEEELLSIKKTDSSTDGPHFFKNIYSMKKYIADNAPIIFSEGFELTRYLKSGSTGIVYEGKYLKGSKQKVGMKFSINQNEQRKKFIGERKREVEILKKLHNKNIINILGNFTIEDYGMCSILEFADYGDLSNFQNNLLQKDYLSETFLNYITKQILDGLFSIHLNKILHMDIKPGNILIDHSLNVKITDFSISLFYDKFKQNEVVIFPLAGTSKFISPEILGRKPVLIRDCSKIDLYSLGVMLYYLAYGEFPYGLKSVDRKQYDKIAEKIGKEELTFPEGFKVSKLFVDFLKGLLNKDFKKRFDIKQALEHPWIQASREILEEKEKTVNLEKFLILLITDSIKKFNDCIKCPLEKYKSGEKSF